MSLQSLRQHVDRIDEQLVRLLNRRARLALDIGQLKQQRKRPVYDARREVLVLRHAASTNDGPLSAGAVRRVFQAILRECRRRERAHKQR